MVFLLVSPDYTIVLICWYEDYSLQTHSVRVQIIRTLYPAYYSACGNCLSLLFQLSELSTLVAIEWKF